MNDEVIEMFGKRGVPSLVPILCGALAISIAACATTQLDPWRRQAESNLRQYYEEQLASDWTSSADIEHLTLEPDRVQQFTIEARSGERLGILGACDDACGNVNFDVFRQGDGTYVTSDEDTEGALAYAFASWGVTGDGAPDESPVLFDVRVTAPACEATRCRVAYWALRRSGETP